MNVCYKILWVRPSVWCRVEGEYCLLDDSDHLLHSLIYIYGKMKAYLILHHLRFGCASALTENQATVQKVMSARTTMRRWDEHGLSKLKLMSIVIWIFMHRLAIRFMAYTLGLCRYGMSAVFVHRRWNTIVYLRIPRAEWMPCECKLTLAFGDGDQIEH